MMLEFLETGKALYVLTAVCVLGLLSRLMARNLYRRLIRETDNMTLTKNRYLRDLRQRTENTYRLNQGIYNTQAYLEKQLAGYRFLGLSLNGWGNLSGQFTVLCFLLGGAAAFGAYWYRCDNYYIVLYGTVGILAGLLTLFVDCGVNLSERRNQLLNGLQDYMENSLFHRLARETASAMEGNVREVSRDGARGADRERGIRELNVRDLNVRDAGMRDGNVRDMNTRNLSAQALGGRADGTRDSAVQDEDGNFVQTSGRGGIRRLARPRNGGEAEDETSGRTSGNKKMPRLARRKNQMDQGDISPVPQAQDDSVRDVDYLKRSLEQIAASRERNQDEGEWIKDLSPNELELVGEILKQYLS